MLERSLSYPSLLLKCDLIRIPICALSLQHGTLYPGKALPDIKGQKAAETRGPDS